MKILRRILFGLVGLVLLLVVAFVAGPRPPKPQLDAALPAVTTDLAALEQEINRSEAAMPNLKPDNQARIVWADSTRKQKTPYSFVYLHGFGASQAEGAPVHTNLARRYGANLYLARLQDHGLGGDSVFAQLTVENYVASAKRALAIAKTLGDTVVAIGTSAGAGLSLYLAANHPEIRALVLYSPCIRLYNETSELIDGPWGKQILRSTVGGDYMVFPRDKPLEKQYWTTRYSIQGLVTLESFLENALVPETFAQVECPVYMAYYYKNEAEQDKVVSVAKMREMFGQLGTPAALKRIEAFPKTGHHVIASYIRSGDWQGVQVGTERFLDETVGLKKR